MAQNTICKIKLLLQALWLAGQPHCCPVSTASAHASSQSQMDGLRKIILTAPLLFCFCLARPGFIQEGQKMAFRYADELAGG